MGRAVVIEAITEPVSVGKGPHWSETEQCLYYVDIDNGLLLKYNATNDAFSRIVIPPGNQRVSFVIHQYSIM
ncbi:hypothetical protein B566_EDAN004913 [Ephemera danica]|nr:hypothetical protein B566_EDAN004913 [Ephemera danica]